MHAWSILSWSWVARGTFFCLASWTLLGSPAAAQDRALNGEPIVASIDPATLTYDVLVDGDLPGDDPSRRRFKTLQAAYEAAPAGTAARPTVIGLRPNVYRLSGGETGPSLSITKDFISLVGLTNNRRAVVLADDRGHSQGATDNSYLLNVNATGFTLRNLTVVNHCNVDYEYPGDPTKNLAKRSDVITQAVALQAAGDKHVYENVALLSRLDTMFLRTTRSYFKNVYIEGTDDFIGGGQISVWEDCTIAFPTGHGVMLASNIVFRDCRFEAFEGMQFYKAEFGSGRGRPVALIRCVLPVSSPQSPVAWVRGQAAPRPSPQSLTYRTTDTTGKPAVIYDSTFDSTHFTYARELADAEARAFNPWNLLRAVPGGNVDDWDPAGVGPTREAAEHGSDVFRITISGTLSIRTGANGTTLRAKILPDRAATGQMKWSTPSPLIKLDPKPDGSVAVIAQNHTDTPQYVPVTATAPGGFFTTEYLYVEPALVDPPAFTAAPTLDRPVDGVVRVRYELDLAGRADQSLVTWFLCSDAAGSDPREIAVTRGSQPLTALILTEGAVGKYLKAAVRPKHALSEPGEAVVAVLGSPITPADVKRRGDDPVFRNFVTTPNESFVSGLWTVQGKWTVEPQATSENDFGIRAGSVGAALLYPQDKATGDMEIEIVMRPEKTEGQGFGSAGSPADDPTAQKAEVFIKYDPRTRNGYSLRFWRTTRSARQCMFQLYKIENGVGTPLDDQQVLSGVFKPTTRLTLKATGTQITATASNSTDSETLSLTGTITPNTYGGAGVSWSGSVPRGNSNVYQRIAVRYP